MSAVCKPDRSGVSRVPPVADGHLLRDFEFVAVAEIFCGAYRPEGVTSDLFHAGTYDACLGRPAADHRVDGKLCNGSISELPRFARRPSTG